MKYIPFSNGTEFMWFEERYCCNCKKFGETEEDECPIYTKMLYAMVDPAEFPHDKVMRILNLEINLPSSRTICIDYEEEEIEEGES